MDSDSDELSGWLTGMGLAQYIDTFVKADFDFSMVSEITRTDLDELGVTIVGHRKKLLLEGAPPPPRPPRLPPSLSPLSPSLRRVALRPLALRCCLCTSGGV